MAHVWPGTTHTYWIKQINNKMITLFNRVNLIEKNTVMNLLQLNA